MLAKPKVLFIGDYCRTDYVSLLKDAAEHCDLLFLFYTSPKEEGNQYYIRYGRSIYWKDYKDVYNLLSTEKPSKVIFLYIESYNHVVLNLACKSIKLPTYHLEHGLRADYVLGFDYAISPPQSLGPSQRTKNYIALFLNLKARLFNRIFLINSIRKLPANAAEFTRHYKEIRQNTNYLETFRKIKSPLRQADIYISFSPRIYEIHKEQDQLGPNQQVCFIGIPYFDRFATLKPEKIVNAILLIDQPLAEQGLLKWNITHKQRFIEALTSVCRKLDYKLYIKPHPRQQLDPWFEAERKGFCTVVDDTELELIAPIVPVVLGFYSTLLMPFAAFEHTTLITYENHPAGNFLVSKPFIEAGVAHPIYNLEELHSILQDVEALHQKQLPHKAKFTEEWMYKFDGKAGERLRDILLSDDL